MNDTMSRRKLLAALTGFGAAGILGLPHWLPQVARAEPTEAKPERFMIIIGAYGGASIIDSFLAVRNSETDHWRTLNTFEDSEVVDIPNSPFRAVDRANNTVNGLPAPYDARQSEFVLEHKDDMMVVTLTNSSVNHQIAQKRSITGNRALAGRTLQEIVAAHHGQGLLMPNVNASADGFAEDGDDPSVPPSVRAERVVDATRWALGLHGSKGLTGVPSTHLIQMARSVRNESLDPESVFTRTFRDSQDLQEWFDLRDRQARLEEQDLFTKLSILGDDEPLSEYGITRLPDSDRALRQFPSSSFDPIEAQAALAYLLIKNGISTAVTISPSREPFVGPDSADLLNLPIAFDNSHTANRDTQAFMWNRMLQVVDGLIELLSSEVYDARTGETYWDRTLIYMATDFGRARERPDDAENFGTAHHLNNGVLLVSPLVNGNTVLGGVDPDTTLTYGFDPVTGAPDPSREFSEGELFAGILQALGISTEDNGLPDIPAMRASG